MTDQEFKPDAFFMVVAPISGTDTAAYSAMNIYQENIDQWGVDNFWYVMEVNVSFMAEELQRHGGDLSRAEWKVRIPT